MTLRFRIKTVDMNGFNGRDNHPERSDIGLVVVPIRMAVDVYDTEDSLIEPTEPTLIAAALNRDTDGSPITADPSMMLCFTCVTEDGRLLDLMEFELEVA